jgi:hypothetical protein
VDKGSGETATGRELLLPEIMAQPAMINAITSTPPAASGARLRRFVSLLWFKSYSST